MKLFTLAFVLFFAFLATFSLAGTFEFQAKNVGDPGVWKYTSTTSFGEQLSPTFGWTGFVLASNTWGEAYVGPIFKPTPWATFALCAGIQNSPQVSRFAAWYYLYHGKLSLLHVMEDGDGRWHKLLVSYSTPYGKMQYWDQDSLGRGPRLEIKGPNKVSIYLSVLRDGEQTNTAFGLIKGF